MSDEKRYTHVRWGDDSTKVEFLDPGWDGCPLFLVGHEFGPTHLIRAESLQDAYDEWLDCQPTVSPDDVHEAYGFSDREDYDLFSKLFETDKEAAWAWAREKCEIEGEGVSVPEDFPPLIEGYKYQPNSSGTGIVDVGYYTWAAEYKHRKGWNLLGNF